MPFDPTIPVANSPIVSAELREQFTSLKALTDDAATPKSGDYTEGVEDVDIVRQPSVDHDTLVMVTAILTVEIPPGSAVVMAYSDENNPPVTLRAIAAYNANSADGENQQQLFFVVKKAHWYKLTSVAVSASVSTHLCYEFPINL